MAIMGQPNTGKSYSRQSIINPEDCFVISPSAKINHLVKDGTPLPEFSMMVGGRSYLDIARANGVGKTTMIKDLAAMESLSEDFSITGNSIIIESLEEIGPWMKFIERHMPHIKNIWLADFTHYISSIIASQSFISRKSGNGAFQRLTHGI